MVLYGSIDQRHPVIMAGCEECTKFWFITQCEECHAWVTDGYVVKEYTETYVLHDTKEVIGSKKIQYTLLHCNWGWDGMDGTMDILFLMSLMLFSLVSQMSLRYRHQNLITFATA